MNGDELTQRWELSAFAMRRSRAHAKRGRISTAQNAGGQSRKGGRRCNTARSRGISALDYGGRGKIHRLPFAMSSDTLRGLLQHLLLNVRGVKFPELVVAYRHEQCRESGDRHNGCSQEFDSHDPPQNYVLRYYLRGRPGWNSAQHLFCGFLVPRKSAPLAGFKAKSPLHRFQLNLVLQLIIQKQKDQGFSGRTGKVAGFTDEGSSRSLM
jgi:hypothetical protein